MAATLNVERVDARSDADLVAAVRAGDDDAFAELYARYHVAIVRFAHGMLRDAQRAEDVAQEAFLSGLRRMQQTERPIHFRPWIYEIARNACIDQYRRSSRAEELSYDAEGLPAGDRAALADRGAGPDRAFEVGEQLDHLRGAFGGLSENHHRILVLREFEGLSYQEIGERMGLTKPSVESTLFRARRRLGEEFREVQTGRRCAEIRGTFASLGASTAGARERRRVQRHLAWCGPCRRAARRAGLGAADLVPAGAGARAAAFLPLPAVKGALAAFSVVAAATGGSLAMRALPAAPLPAPPAAAAPAAPTPPVLPGEHGRRAAATREARSARTVAASRALETRREPRPRRSAGPPPTRSSAPPVRSDPPAPRASAPRVAAPVGSPRAGRPAAPAVVGPARAALPPAVLPEPVERTVAALPVPAPEAVATVTRAASGAVDEAAAALGGR